jgi:hypothetical protein
VCGARADHHVAGDPCLLGPEHPQIARPSSRDEKAIVKTLTQAICSTAARAGLTEHLRSTEVPGRIGQQPDLQALRGWHSGRGKVVATIKEVPCAAC